MKKLLLTLIGCLTCLFGNSQTLYVIGAGVKGNDGVNQGWALNTNQMTYDSATGTYTWKGQELKNEFKINDGSWNGSYNIGSNGSELTIGTPYNASNNGSSGNISFAGGITSVKNPTVTLKISGTTYTITVTGAEDSSVEISLAGSFNNNSQSDNTYNLTAGADQVFTGTFTFAAANPLKFQVIVNHSSWLGYKDNAAITFNGTNPVTKDLASGYQNDFEIANWPGGEISFTVDYANQTVTLVANTDVEIAYPDEYYIMGYVNDGDFTPNKGVKSTSATDGVYTFENLNIITAYDNDYGYFNFCANLADTAEDSGWGQLTGRYGAEEADYLIAAGQNANIKSGDASFKILPGNYTITLNLKEQKVYVAAVGDVNPTPDYYPKMMYIVGANVDGNDWETFTPAQTAEEGLYTWTLSSLGTKFKFTDVQGWYGDYNLGTNGSELELGEPYTYSDAEGVSDIAFADNIASVSNAKVVLDLKAQTVTVTGKPEYPTEPAVLYVRAKWNEFGTTDLMTTDDETVYTWTGNVDAAEEVAFKVADADWGLYNFGAGDGNEGIYVYSNQPGVTTLVNNGGDLYINNWEGGEMTITFNLQSKVVSVAGKDQPAYTAPVDQKYYLIGNFNMWATEDPDYELTLVDGEYFGAFDMPSNLEYEGQENVLAFKVFSGDWTTSFGGLDEATNGDQYLTVEANEPVMTPMYVGTVSKNWIIEGLEGDANISFTVNVDEMTLVITSSVSGIENLDKASNNGEEVIYNLQGVRVNRNNLGKGLYIINGKKVMVK